MALEFNKVYCIDCVKYYNKKCIPILSKPIFEECKEFQKRENKEYKIERIREEHQIGWF